VIPIVKSLPVRAFLRTVTNPIVALGLFVGVFTVWHFPVFFEAAVESDGLHVVQHVIFAAVAYAYWWNVIDPVPLKPNIGYLARIPYTFIVVVPNFALSAFLTFSASAWYSHYEIPAATHGFTAIQDQQLGGLIMWIPGSFIIGTAMLWVLYLALRSEQRHQMEREAAEEA
jgi:cytochrome c oxidase assembly factor CtaG